MILLSHPTANQFSRNLLDALEANRLLTEFHTTIHWNDRGFIHSFLPAGLKKELARRSFPEAIASKTRSHPIREWGRLFGGKLGFKGLTRHEVGGCSLDAVYRSLDQDVARRVRSLGKSIRGVYAYEDGALESFWAAKECGVSCIYDLPIAYWKVSRKLYEEEAERLPGWKDSLIGNEDSKQKCERKTEELELADLVVCPSEFVYHSIPESVRAAKKVVIAPFGTPSYSLEGEISIGPKREGKIKFIFAGSMSQRKGLADLFSAWKILDRSDIELHVFGSPVMELEFYREQCPEFIYHEPRPHREVLELMRSCDVFILPSIVEGRAQVMQEAMSQGLPIIITPNTGGSDLVDEQKTGFLVPIRSPEAIAEKINWFADHADQIMDMGKMARDKASALSWQNYQDLILRALREENIV